MTFQVKMHNRGGVGRCERNPCPKEKMTPLDYRCLPRDDTMFARCYTIGEREPCKGGSYLLIDNSLALPFCLPFKPNSITAPRTKRDAPCVVGHRHDCVRKCDGPETYGYQGIPCRHGFTYFRTAGPPQCVRLRCKRTSY